MGKDVAKMFLQAVVFGIGVEVGKDLYAVIRGRGRAAPGVLPDANAELPADDDDDGAD